MKFFYILFALYYSCCACNANFMTGEKAEETSATRRLKRKRVCNLSFLPRSKKMRLDYITDPKIENQIEDTHKNKKFKCPYAGCSKSCSHKSNLTRHINSVHKKIRFKCSYAGCSKSYSCKSNLTRHINSAHKRIRYECPYAGCSKSFSDKGNLTQHISSVHEKIRFKCYYSGCGKSYSKKGNLNKHINSKHNNPAENL